MLVALTSLIRPTRFFLKKSSYKAAAILFIPDDNVLSVADIIHETYKPSKPGVGTETYSFKKIKKNKKKKNTILKIIKF